MRKQVYRRLTSIPLDHERLRDEWSHLLERGRRSTYPKAVRHTTFRLDGQARVLGTRSLTFISVGPIFGRTVPAGDELT